MSSLTLSEHSGHYSRSANPAGICRHRPSSSYIRALVKRATRNEPTLQEEQTVSALESFPMAGLCEGKGVVFCDVLDAHAFLGWLADSMADSKHWAESFQHRRQEVLNRTLVHEGAEWMARRLDLFPVLDSALKEFLTAGHIEERFFVDQFGAEYGMDISDGPEGVYHLFAEACDDYRVLPLQKHLPGGILASAAAFLLKILSSSGLLTTFTKHIKEQVPELPKETYLLDEAGHPAFEDIRQMLEPRGLRIAPLQQVREVDRLIKRLHRCQKNPVERKTALEELVKWVPGLADFFDIFQISESPLVELTLEASRQYDQESLPIFRQATHPAGSRSSAITRTLSPRCAGSAANTPTTSNSLSSSARNPATSCSG